MAISADYLGKLPIALSYTSDMQMTIKTCLMNLRLFVYLHISQIFRSSSGKRPPPLHPKDFLYSTLYAILQSTTMTPATKSIHLEEKTEQEEIKRAKAS